MAEIIPAILAKSLEEFSDKIKKVENLVEMVQIDVADGKFVPNETFNDVEQIKGIATNLEYEVHLMVSNVEESVDEWLKLKPVRIIFHIEAVENGSVDNIIQTIKDSGTEVGLAINPDTRLSEIESYLNKIHMILVMGVNPGFSGQEFQESVIERVKEIKNRKTSVKISVDGGVSVDNARELALAGVDVLSMSSAIFESGDVKGTIKALRDKVII